MNGLTLVMETSIMFLVLCNAVVVLSYEPKSGSNSGRSIGIKQGSLQQVASAPFGCPAVIPKGNVTVVCTHSIEKLIKGVNCSQKVPLGTKATFKCPKQFFSKQKYRSIKCVLPGVWNKSKVVCRRIPTTTPTLNVEPMENNTDSTISDDTITSEETTNDLPTTAPPTEEESTTVVDTTPTTTTTATTTWPTAAATTVTTTAATTTTTAIPPGYVNVTGVGVVKKPAGPNTITYAKADCQSAGAFVMTITNQAKLDYVNAYMSSPSTTIGAANPRDTWVGIEFKNQIWQTMRGVPISSIPFIKWAPTAPLVGTFAVFAIHLQYHWDIPQANGALFKFPYLCEK